MTLTLNEIYDRYSVREFARVIEVKRLKTDGNYEDDWQDIETLSKLSLLDNAVDSINYSLSNNSYNFGIINVGNVKLTLNSKNGQFDDENNTGSIFYQGYVRHKSLIRVRDGYVDHYTDENNPVNVLNTVFLGFIDATSNNTKVDDDNLNQFIQCIDLLSFLLKSYTIADMGTLSSTTLNALVYEILNRTEFTTFFNVNSLNISAGYNISSFDISQYEGQTQLLTLFQNFSIGHSFFYVKDNEFYYNSISDGNESDFAVDEKKLIKFSGFSNGIENVFERLYWQDDETVSFESLSNNYNQSQTISIDGVLNTVQRQNILNAIGAITERQKRKFNIAIPYYPDIQILDKITIASPEIFPDDAFIWGVSKWGEKRWRKALKADNISNNQIWLVREIKHTDLVTNITLEEII